MDLRIMGTKEECRAFTDMVRKTVPESSIKSISGWYANKRKDEFSTEGRVYISFRETITELPPAALPEEKKSEERSPQVGRCYFCKKSPRALAILMLNRDRYEGVCPECARRYLDEQYVGSYLRETHPEIYEKIMKKLHPKILGVYMSGHDAQTIYDDGGHIDWDELEGES